MDISQPLTSHTSLFIFSMWTNGSWH